MGFNTVAFMLNDLAHEIEKSPHQVAFMLANPHISGEAHHRGVLMQYLRDIADKHNEQILHSQALQVLPTFHASEAQYFRAGGNCIAPLTVVRYGKDRKTGKNTVTLELPDWWDRKHHG